MTGGWRTQFERLQRWYRRASNAADPIDRLDFLYAFFENAFHLRDWLVDAGVVSHSDMRAFFNAHEDMRLCRDLANAHKHFSIRDPSQPLPPSEVHEYSPKGGSLSADVSLVVLSDGKKHDVVDLAGRILHHWTNFVDAFPSGDQ
jgi:hypothetical protein